MRRSSARNSRRNRASRLESGSSNSTRSGSAASARGQRHPLLLSAGKLRRLALGQLGQPRRFPAPARPVRSRGPRRPRAPAAHTQRSRRLSGAARPQSAGRPSRCADVASARRSFRRWPNRMSPPSGAMKPATMRSSVVLPQPDGPTSPKISPSAISNETSSTGRAAPNDLRRWRRVTFMSGGLRARSRDSAAAPRFASRLPARCAARDR